MAESQTNLPPASKEQYTKIIALTALVVLAIVVLTDKFASARRTSDYDARAKRSEALLTSGEQREQQYRDYFRGLEEDRKRNDALRDKTEELNARFEKILATWERQQREYQVYLDSLKEKQH